MKGREKDRTKQLRRTNVKTNAVAMLGASAGKMCFERYESYPLFLREGRNKQKETLRKR
jgi:hypothetical protein